MKEETELKFKFGIWGIVGGAVLTMIIGFTWSGWSTEATTDKLSEKAVLASRSAICAAQFMNDSSHEAKLKEFEELAGYKREEFVEEGGWDRMPGEEKAEWTVSNPCFTEIETLLKTAQSAVVPVGLTVQN